MNTIQTMTPCAAAFYMGRCWLFGPPNHEGQRWLLCNPSPYTVVSDEQGIEWARSLGYRVDAISRGITPKAPAKGYMDIIANLMDALHGTYIPTPEAQNVTIIDC